MFQLHKHSNKNLSYMFRISLYCLFILKHPSMLNSLKKKKKAVNIYIYSKHENISEFVSLYILNVFLFQYFLFWIVARIVFYFSFCLFPESRNVKKEPKANGKCFLFYWEE